MLSGEMHYDRATLLDVGCRDTPVAQWGQFIRRYSVDYLDRPPLKDVMAFKKDFLSWKPPEHFSVITCCQVLEHLGDAELPLFVSKMKAISDYMIITVPFMWSKGDEEGHKQDPISKEKFHGMIGKIPVEEIIVLDGKRARLCALIRNLP
jgi:hypothetical protein